MKQILNSTWINLTISNDVHHNKGVPELNEIIIIAIYSKIGIISRGFLF